MGVTLASAARRFARDSFESWLPATDTFSAAQQGRLFRADRFTTIYHKPTRRVQVSLLSTWPASGVVRRTNGGEIMLLGEAERVELSQGSAAYDRLRQAHLIQAPTGGAALYHAATVSGTGDDLGLVSLGAGVKCYADLELQAVSDPPNSIDYSLGRYVIHHSANISPRAGDYLQFNGRWLLLEQPYAEGGFRVARSREIPVGYRALTYLRPAAANYDSATGIVTAGETARLFSGIVEQSVAATEEPQYRPATVTLGVFKAHLGFAPRAGDRVSMDGQPYLITTVEEPRDGLQWRLKLEA